jgi:sterol-4alpha-carboxylate 3-dehydrogenase (decarboxylating)
MPCSSPFGFVLVGGCGFVRHHIVRRVLENNDSTQITVMSQNIDQNHLNGMEYHSGDILFEPSVRTVFNKVQPRIVINIVAPITFTYQGTPDYHYRINVKGTTTLLRCATACSSVVAFIYTFSALIMAAPEYTNAKESDPILTHDPSGRKFYNSTKGIAVRLTRRAKNTLPTDQGGLCTATIRPSSIFGEDNGRLLPSILYQLDSGARNFQLCSNTVLFDFVYVGNVADTLVRESPSRTTYSAQALPNPSAANPSPSPTTPKPGGCSSARSGMLRGTTSLANG